MKKLAALLLLFLALSSNAQFDPINFQEDELNIGGDIFSDFNEDLENTQVMEDERFYKFGRLFSFQLGLGLTQFGGNRGQLYEDDHPSYGMGINYFVDFQTAFGMGFEFSKHHFFMAEETQILDGEPLGFVDVSLLRVFLSWRYYIDTSDLGTALTYSNPYFIGRMEYWYTTTKYVDQEDLPNDKGGGLGVGLGFGFDFPIRIRESYINAEFLWHRVNFHDKYTDDYAQVNSEGNLSGGVADLTGDGYTMFVSYVFNW
ncbi:hypothetical protein HBN50_09105 [Halobacteriovorax sp. GB3]|uniref:hypothetical protein n=1 Tax=Halobacteriovorax sp. GB3 TaxID=2719615 RepID=UPI00235E7CA3|nr:hypothetical protein [Halobacteriovorax sp. GB3]MDD0853255.1 hypothetical protein [Halobacteriovorax sp. GB3]